MKKQLEYNDMKDALEAYQTFRSARNFFFGIMLISLIVLQTIFWVVNQGHIDAVLNFDQDHSQSVFVHRAHHALPAIFTLQTADESPEPDSKTLDAFIRISLRFFNTTICFMALLYCLSLLIGMKLCLVGRLGGLAESGRAFFLSLVVLVLIVPWQPLIAGGTPGTIFSYPELTGRYIESATYMTLLSLDAIAYYVRFVGFWGLTILLLLAAQWRTIRAGKQITQRCRVKQIVPPLPVVPENHTQPIIHQSSSTTIPLDTNHD